jgi:heat shock protein HtpX
MLPAHGLYGHIRNNNIKSAALLATFGLYVTLLWFVCCFVWIGLSTKFEPIIMRLANRKPTFAGLWELTLTRTLDVALGYAFLPVGMVIIWFAIAYAFHKSMIRAGTGARPVSRSLDWDLYNMVENQAIAAGLPTPSIEIIETDALNAYASGLGATDATIAVTRGLLETLGKDELEAVLAHELTHIRNRDVRLMTVAIIFVGILAFGAQVLGRTVWGRPSAGGRGQPLALNDIVVFAVAGALAGIGYLFGLLTRFALSRTREFLADAGAVTLTKKPEALISALRTISAHDAVPGVPASLQAMMISSRIEGLFATHPPVEARIAALERYAGARGPAGPAKALNHAFGARVDQTRPSHGRPMAMPISQPQVSFGRRASRPSGRHAEVR